MSCSSAGRSTSYSITISTVSISPTFVSLTVTSPILFALTYSSGKDLSSLTYTYEGTTTEVDLSSEGCTAQTSVCNGVLIGPLSLSDTIGKISISIFVKDTAGDISNTVSTTLTQVE